ncbi:hypothetical protein SSYRP_v1c05060 [Spiroplasma syrphidicola EA-1]|uniref:Transmembrane protein n=1 Tax=Spiroplasma syrphidicola EA-1 TaxID=1276229 RepID=R4U666_9MOLU|nr:DUF3137 domain-containing protein [Spiroplasma syrphidicola]AGM26098.1 hypothetical protein SSYRP_v1c05060 [Spiroplasma syrphidicola EA-1]
MEKLALSNQTKDKIRALHYEHISKYYQKNKSFFISSVTFKVFFVIMLILSIALMITGGILLDFKFTFLISLILLLSGVIVFAGLIVTMSIISARSIKTTLFLNQLNYNQYYQIAIDDYFKDKVILEVINNQFNIMPVPNFTSVSKNPRKNNLLQESLIRVSSLKEKMDNKVINGSFEKTKFSLGVITVRKTMVFLKGLVILAYVALFFFDLFDQSDVSYLYEDEKEKVIKKTLNFLSLMLLVEMKRSENYFFFSTKLPVSFNIEANIVPHQNEFKKFVLRNKEINFEGNEFNNIFDTNTTNPVELRKILSPKAMANLIDYSRQYQEALSMSFVNDTYTLLLDKYSYSKKNHHLNQIWKPLINSKTNIETCIDDLITKIEIDLFHLEKSLNYLKGFDID